jgi:hypothetical protein
LAGRHVGAIAALDIGAQGFDHLEDKIKEAVLF